jgi:hypothetical protein
MYEVFPKEKEITVRGTVLYYYVTIEKYLATILLFLNENLARSEDYKEVNFKRLRNQEKIEVAKKMTKTFLPTLSDEYEAIFNTLDELREFRNIFSHCSIQTKSPKTDRFIYWDIVVPEDKCQYYWEHYYTMAELENNMKKLEEVIPQLEDLVIESIKLLKKNS